MGQARLVANAQTIDLGQVEWNKPVRLEFVVSNEGDSPLVLTEVLASCGCSVPNWSSEPIPPKGKSTISVDFDAKSLGKFHRDITIYSNSSPNLTYLYFTGTVVSQITDFKNSHPIKVGNIRIDRDTLNFGTIMEGDKKDLTINFVNEGSSAYRPILMHTPSFIKVKPSEDFVQKGEGGQFNVEIDTELYKTYGLVNTEVYLSRFVGDKVSQENRIPVSFVIIPNFSIASNGYPELKMNTDNAKLKEKLKHENKAKGYVVLENVSSGVLEILKIQTFSPAVTVQLKKRSLGKGESSKLVVKIDKLKMLTPEDNLTILLITNDSNNKVVRIDL